MKFLKVSLFSCALFICMNLTAQAESKFLAVCQPKATLEDQLTVHLFKNSEDDSVIMYVKHGSRVLDKDSGTFNYVSNNYLFSGNKYSLEMGRKDAHFTNINNQGLSFNEKLVCVLMNH